MALLSAGSSILSSMVFREWRVLSLRSKGITTINSVSRIRNNSWCKYHLTPFIGRVLTNSPAVGELTEVEVEIDVNLAEKPKHFMLISALCLKETRRMILTPHSCCLFFVLRSWNSVCLCYEYIPKYEFNSEHSTLANGSKCHAD